MQAIINITNETAGVSRLSRLATRTLRQVSIALALIMVAALLVQPGSASAAGPRGLSSASNASSHNSSESHLLAATGAPQAQDEVYIMLNGQPLHGSFLAAFKRYGLGVIGYPLTPELNEGGVTVQYFERVKMEFHPELVPVGIPVLFTRLGVNISAGSAFGKARPFITTRLASYFNETGHSLGGSFLQFWQNNGGVQLFGFPISEVINQDGMSVQWFERARMEYHPELAAQGQPVQLTLLGRIAQSRAYPSAMRTAPAPPNSAPSNSLNGMENGLLGAINAQRSATGLAQVSVAADVTALARSRSSDMATRNYFSHTNPDGKTFIQLLLERGISFTLAGEILAENNFSDGEAVSNAMSGFLDSPPHKAIMLDGRYTQVGVGYAKGANGMHYFTAIFIRK